jgi:hypothetical protein
MSGHLSLIRHAELVSASIVPLRPSARAAKWTLKQVQGDGCVLNETFDA